MGISQRKYEKRKSKVKIKELFNLANGDHDNLFALSEDGKVYEMAWDLAKQDYYFKPVRETDETDEKD